jgi:hypothetical protein
VKWGAKMNESMDKIQSLATERFNLYRLAGKQHLTPEQLDRLHEIEGRLPGLWDVHRRELAAVRKPESPKSFAYFDAA